MAMKPHLPCPDTPQRRRNRKSIENYLKLKYPDSTFPSWKAVDSGRKDGVESKPVAAKCEGVQANDLTSSFVDKRSHCSSQVESGQRNSGNPAPQTSTKVSQPEADAWLRGNQVRRAVVTTESHGERGTCVLEVGQRSAVNKSLGDSENSKPFQSVNLTQSEIGLVPKKKRGRPKKDVAESKIVSVPSPPVLPIPKSVLITDNEQNPPVVELPHRSSVKNSPGNSKNHEPSHVTNVAQSEIGLAPKRKRGRPKKGITHVTNVTQSEISLAPKRKRRRPKKGITHVTRVIQSEIGLVPKRKRGRPKKGITKPTIVCVSSSPVPPIPKSVLITDDKQNSPVVELHRWSPVESSQGDSNSEPSRLTSVTQAEISVGLENSRRRPKEDTEPQNVCDSSSPIISHIGHHPSGCEIPVATSYPMITQLPGSEKAMNYKLPEVRLNRLKYELYDHIERDGFISFSRVMLEMGLTSYMAQSKTRTLHSQGQTLPSACKDQLAVTSSKSLVDISSNYSLPDGTPYDHLCQTPGNGKLYIKEFLGLSSPEKDPPVENIMKPRSRTSPKQYGRDNIEDTIISSSEKSSRTNKSGCEPAKNLLSNGAKRAKFGLHDFRLDEQCVKSKTVGKNRSKSQPPVVRQSPKKRWKSNMPIRPKSMCTKHGKLRKPKKIVKKSETKLPVEELGDVVETLDSDDEDISYSMPVVVQQVIMQRLVMHNVPYEQPSQSHELVPADMIPTVSKNVWESAGHDDTISIASSAEYLDSSDSENERMVQSLIEKENDYSELQDICYISVGTQHHAPSNVELEDYCYVSKEDKRDVPSNGVDLNKQLDNLLEQQRPTSPAAALVNTSVVRGTAPNCNQGPSNQEESVSTTETPLSFNHDESNSSTRKEQVRPRTLNDFVKGNELEVDPADRVESFTPNKMQSILSSTELVENVETVGMPPSQMISKEEDDSKSEQPGVLSTPEKSVAKLTLSEKKLAPCLELRSNFNGVTELKKDFTPQEVLSSSHVNSFESVIHEGISRSSPSGTTSNKEMKGENIQNSANEVAAYKPSLIDNSCKKTTDNQGDGLTTDKYMSASTVRSVQTILPLESPEEERSRPITPEVFVQEDLEDFSDYICGSLSNQNDLINQEDGFSSIQNHHITPASSIEDIDSLERTYRNSLIEKSLNGTYKDIQIHSFEPEVSVEQSPYSGEGNESNSKLTSDYSDPNNLDEALNVPTNGETMHDDPFQSGCPPSSVEKLSHVDKSIESTSTLSEDDIVLTDFKNCCIQGESCSVTSADLIGNMEVLEVLEEVQKEPLLTSASVLSDKQLTLGDKSRETCSALSLDNNDVRYQENRSTSDQHTQMSQVDSVENMEASEGAKTYRELCGVLMSLEEQSHKGESGSSCSNSALILNHVSVPNTALSPVAGQKILLAKPGKNLNGLFTIESIEGMELLQGEETNQPHVSKLSAKEAMLTEGSTESCCKLPFTHSYAIDHEYSCNSVVYQSTSSVQSSGSLKTVQPSVSVKNGGVEKNRLLQPCGFESSVEESSLVEECSESCTDLPSVLRGIATNEKVFNAVMNQSISSVKSSNDLNTISPTESVENVEPLEGADEDQLLESCTSEFIEESSFVEECTESCSELPLIPNVVNIPNAIGNQYISPAESCRIPNTISPLEAVHGVGKDQLLSCESELSIEQPLLDEQGTILCSGLPLIHYDDNIADQDNESTSVVNQMVSSAEPSENLVTLKETNDYIYKKTTESERTKEVLSQKGISSEFSENSYESFSALCSDHLYSKRQDGGSNSSENRSMLPSESVGGMERLGKAGGGSLGDISPIRSSNVLSNDDTNEEKIAQSTLEVFIYKHSDEKSKDCVGDIPAEQIEGLAHVEPQPASLVVSCENDNAVDGIFNQITVNGSNIKKAEYSISLEPSRSSTPEILRADLTSHTATNRDDLPKKSRTLSPQQSKLSSFGGKSSLSEICGVSFMQAFNGVESTNLGELFTSESTFPLVDKSLIRSNGGDEDFYEKSQGSESADFLEMSYFTEALGDVCLRDNLPESSENCLPSMHVVESADFPSASPADDFVEESAKDGGQLAESGAVADLPEEFANECLDLQQMPTLSSSTDLSDQNVLNPPNICSSPELIFDGIFCIDDPIDLPCGGDLNKLCQYEPKSDVFQSSSLHGPPYEKDSVVNPDDHRKSLNITDQETETNTDLTSKPPSNATQPGDSSLSFELSRPLPCQIADGSASSVNNVTGNKSELGGEISFSLPNREVSLTVVPHVPETVDLSDETAPKRKQYEGAEIGISRKVNDLLFDEEFEPCNNVTPVKRSRVEKRMSPCTAIPEGSILFDEEFESSNNLTPAKKFRASSRDQVTVSRVFTRTSSDLLFDEEFEQSNNVTPFKEQMSGINRLKTPSPQTVRLTALGPVNELVIDDNDDPPLNGTSESVIDSGKRLTGRNTAEGCVVISSDEESETPLTNNYPSLSQTNVISSDEESETPLTSNYPSLSQTNSARPINRPVMQVPDKTSAVPQNRPVGRMRDPIATSSPIKVGRSKGRNPSQERMTAFSPILELSDTESETEFTDSPLRKNSIYTPRCNGSPPRKIRILSGNSEETSDLQTPKQVPSHLNALNCNGEVYISGEVERSSHETSERQSDRWSHCAPIEADEVSPIHLGGTDSESNSKDGVSRKPHPCPTEESTTSHCVPEISSGSPITTPVEPSKVTENSEDIIELSDSDNENTPTSLALNSSDRMQCIVRKLSTDYLDEFIESDDSSVVEKNERNSSPPKTLSIQRQSLVKNYSKQVETLFQKKGTSKSDKSSTESHPTHKEASVGSDGENSDTMTVGGFIESDDCVCTGQEKASCSSPDHSASRQTLNHSQKSTPRTVQTLRPPSLKRVVIRQNRTPLIIASSPSLSKKLPSAAICIGVPVEGKNCDGSGSNVSSDTSRFTSAEALPSKLSETLNQKKISHSKTSYTESHRTFKEALIISDGENSDTMPVGDFIESDDDICSGQEEASCTSLNHSVPRQTLSPLQKSKTQTLQTPVVTKEVKGPSGRTVALDTSAHIECSEIADSSSRLMSPKLPSSKPPSTSQLPTVLTKSIVIRQNSKPSRTSPPPSLSKKLAICVKVPVEDASYGPGSETSSDEVLSSKPLLSTCLRTPLKEPPTGNVKFKRTANKPKPSAKGTFSSSLPRSRGNDNYSFKDRRDISSKTPSSGTGNAVAKSHFTSTPRYLLSPQHCDLETRIQEKIASILQIKNKPANNELRSPVTSKHVLTSPICDIEQVRQNDLLDNIGDHLKDDGDSSCSTTPDVLSSKLALSKKSLNFVESVSRKNTQLRKRTSAASRSTKTSSARGRASRGKGFSQPGSSKKAVS